MGDYPISAVRGASAQLPTPGGQYTIFAYRDVASGKEHAALVLGKPAGKNVLTRMHSECLTGDLFGSLRCDCGPQLGQAFECIEAEGEGVVLYLRQEGRGIGLIEKIAAYELQENGADTVEANRELGHPDDARTYHAAADMLRDLGITSVRLLTNNPAKVEALETLGVPVVERVPIEIAPNSKNAQYLRTKRDRMGHLLGDG